MAHEHTHDIKPASVRATGVPGCGDCCHPVGSATVAPDAQQTLSGQRFRVPAMDCAAEESEIRRAVEGIPGLVGLRFQLGERSLRIDGEPQAASPTSRAAHARGERSGDGQDASTARRRRAGRAGRMPRTVSLALPRDSLRPVRAQKNAHKKTRAKKRAQ